MLNLASNLSRSAFVFPERTAAIGPDGQLTYRQLDARCSQTAQGLRQLGVQPGDTVALACGNCVAFVIAYYALLRAGAIVVPLNILFKPEEFAHHFRDAQVKAIICQEGDAHCPTAARAWQAWRDGGRDPRFFIVAQGVPPADAPPPLPGGLVTLTGLAAPHGPVFDNHPSVETDTAVILYTSGTTGLPKGAELSHSNLALNAAYSCLMQKADSRDVHLVALPLFHSFGQTMQLNAAITVGACLVLMPRFDARLAWVTMAAQGVTLFAGVPTMYQGLLEAHAQMGEGAFAPRWRLGMSGGAALPMAVIEAFEQRLGLEMLEGYGLSETSPLATFSFPDTPRQAGCVGYPLYGTEVRLAALSGEACGHGDGRGQIEVRGHHVMKGYHRQTAATQETVHEGWLSTGDIGRFEDNGSLRIVDRAKDIIIRGGYNIYPREIEDVLLQHPAVQHVAVVGLADGRLGEEVAAAVVLHPHALASEAQLIAWSRERIAAYKYPRHVYFLEALPRNATGKVLKQPLRQALSCAPRSPA